jgi:hypothetical protein
MFSIFVPENMVCKILQDLISSNKTVHPVSHEYADFVKLIARNPDEEFDGVRCEGYSRKIGNVRMILFIKWLLL